MLILTKKTKKSYKKIHLRLLSLEKYIIYKCFSQLKLARNLTNLLFNIEVNFPWIIYVDIIKNIVIITEKCWVYMLNVSVCHIFCRCWNKFGNGFCRILWTSVYIKYYLWIWINIGFSINLKVPKKWSVLDIGQ